MEVAGSNIIVAVRQDNHCQCQHRWEPQQSARARVCIFFFAVRQDNHSSASIAVIPNSLHVRACAVFFLFIPNSLRVRARGVRDFLFLLIPNSLCVRMRACAKFVLTY